MTNQTERTVRYLSSWLFNIQDQYSNEDFAEVKEMTVALVTNGLRVRQVQKLFLEN